MGGQRHANRCGLTFSAPTKKTQSAGRADKDAPIGAD